MSRPYNQRADDLTSALRRLTLLQERGTTAPRMEMEDQFMDRLDAYIDHRIALAHMLTK